MGDMLAADKSVPIHLISPAHLFFQSSEETDRSIQKL